MFLVMGRYVTVILFLHVIVLVNINETRNFFGPKMCRHFCEHLFGCSVFVFSSSHLICHVDPEKQAEPVGGWTVAVNNNQVYNRILAAMNLKCAQYSRIFYSRGDKLTCALTVIPASEETIQHKQPFGSRILLTQRMSRKQQPLHLFHFHNTSFTLYPNVTLKYVRATAYFPPLGRIIISLAYPYRLSYFTEDDIAVKTMRVGISCSAITSDTKRKLLILAVGFGMQGPGIYSLTSDGKTHKLLFNITQPSRHKFSHPSGLVVDVKRDCVYICLWEKILSADLEGTSLTVLYKGSLLRGLDLDSKGEALYFAEGYNLLHLSLKSSVVVETFSLKTQILGIVYYKDYVHVSGKYYGSLTSVAVRVRKKSITSYHLPNIESKQTVDMIICAVG